MNAKIAVIGSGYVGLTIATCFASKGFKVICVDVDEEKVNKINSAVAPFYEPELDKLLKKGVDSGALTATTDINLAVSDANISFICVGTPSKPDGSIDLSHVKEATKSVGKALRERKGYHLVVVKSTVIPGTTERLILPIIKKESGMNLGEDFGLAANPEFLREGSAVKDFLNPDRIIIGGCDDRSTDELEGLYRAFYGSNMPPIVKTTPSTAELIKYANNAFLAMKVSFINTIANICERTLNADVAGVAKGIGLDERISGLFLKAGLGYGGPCLSKDIKALISYSRSVGYKPILLEAVEDVNNAQPRRAIELAKTLIGDLRGKRVAILGLSFKPNTSDMRNAVSIKLINYLLRKEAKVVAYDPVAIDNARKIFKDKIQYAGSPIECIQNADCCIVVTEWDEFKKLKPEDFLKHMKTPAVIDGRRIYDPAIYAKTIKFAAIGLSSESTKFE